MQSLSRITGMLETARDLTLEAARDASARRATSTSTSTPSLNQNTIRKLLDSRRDAEILDGLKRVASIFYNFGPNAAAPLFTAVIKNVASSNSAVRRLVYALLIQLAEDAPDTALLSVNSIQKLLSDQNPTTRATALRTMSAIRVPVISQIVALGIKRGTGDMSPVVRRQAALAAIKCARLDPATKPVLIEHIGKLLGDRQFLVVGAAIEAWTEVCPDRIDLIHPNYKGLVKKMIDMDEWGQCATLSAMIIYGRKCFPRKQNKGGKTMENVILDSDLEFLLDSAKSLLQSRSTAVINAVARLYYYLGTQTYISFMPESLISTLRSSTDLASQSIHTILTIVQVYPTLFVPYATHFFASINDPPMLTTTKLSIQATLFPHLSDTLQTILLTDLAHTSHSTTSSPSTLQATILALGRIASTAPTYRSRCLQLLLTHLSSPIPSVLSSALAQIRALIQADPSAHTKTVVRLARHLDALTPPDARAGIIWLVGEHATRTVAADTWRVILKSFPTEHSKVQSQVVLLACKVYLATTDDPATSSANKQRIRQMLDHTFLLARYAQQYEVRDRARWLAALVRGASLDLGRLLLGAEKTLPDAAREVDERRDGRDGLVGYASRILGVAVRGMDGVPDWTPVEVGRRERAGDERVSADERGAKGGLAGVTGMAGSIAAPEARDLVRKGAGNGALPKTLDEWLDEEVVEEQNVENDDEGMESEETEEETDDDDEETDDEESEYESEYESENDDNDDEKENDRLIKS